MSFVSQVRHENLQRPHLYELINSNGGFVQVQKLGKLSVRILVSQVRHPVFLLHVVQD
jgi:hypothetical protein